MQTNTRATCRRPQQWGAALSNGSTRLQKRNGHVKVISHSRSLVQAEASRRRLTRCWDSRGSCLIEPRSSALVGISAISQASTKDVCCLVRKVPYPGSSVSVELVRRGPVHRSLDVEQQPILLWDKSAMNLDPSCGAISTALALCIYNSRVAHTVSTRGVQVAIDRDPLPCSRFHYLLPTTPTVVILEFTFDLDKPYTRRPCLYSPLLHALA